MELTYEQVNDLLHAYGIGALEADEQDAVDEYFDRQQALMDRLARIESATTLLARGTAVVAVNADAQDSIMDRIHADLAARNLVDDAVDSPVQEKREGTPDRTGSPRGARTENGGLSASSNRSGNGSRDGRSSLAQGKQLPSLREQRVPLQRPLSAANKDGYPTNNTVRQGFFSRQALANAALATSLAGLLLISFFYVRGEQRNNLMAAEADGIRVRAAEAESQLADLNQMTLTLSSEAAQLAEKNEALVAEQESLAKTNLELVDKLTAAEDKNRDQNVRNLTLFAQKTQVESQLALYENQVDEISGRLGVVGAASQATVMFGTVEAPGLQGTFFHASEKGELVIHGLKPLPEEQTYQFWLVTENGEQVSAGIFGIEENQEPTWVNLNLPQNLPQYTLAGISIEPANGSDAPTGPMLLESGLETEESSDTLS